jgi:hypothetical protein
MGVSEARGVPLGALVAVRIGWAALTIGVDVDAGVVAAGGASVVAVAPDTDANVGASVAVVDARVGSRVAVAGARVGVAVAGTCVGVAVGRATVCEFGARVAVTTG